MWGVFEECSALVSVRLPNGITNINPFTLHGCISLTKVHIPNSVTPIEEGAFHSCHQLTSITIPDSVTYIGRSAFYKCIALIKVNIPTTITFINESTFFKCRSLREVHIPSTVTSIKDYALYYCASLHTIIFSMNITCIGIWAFGSCSSLTKVNIPNSVIQIRDGAFSECTSLVSVFIPASVKYFGDSMLPGSSVLRVAVILCPISRADVYKLLETSSQLSILVLSNTVFKLLDASIISNRNSKCRVLADCHSAHIDATQALYWNIHTRCGYTKHKQVWLGNVLLVMNRLSNSSDTHIPREMVYCILNNIEWSDMNINDNVSFTS